MTNDTTGGPGDKFGGATDDDLVDFTRKLRETEGQLSPDPEPGTLTAEHADFLTRQAVDLDLARALGVRSVTERQHMAGLGDFWENWANFPAILFPWTGPDGRVEYQVRPDHPTLDARGKLRKYVFRKDMTPVLWRVGGVPDAPRILIVEGTKQALCAASYAPPGTEIYGIAGCRMWQLDGVPIGDLMVADEREVVIILDQDAATNPDVYSAGTGLAESLAMEGAISVKFGRLGAIGKSGLDDVLGHRDPVKRAGYLARIVESAKPKPADKAPRPRKKQQDAPGDSEGQRVTLVCNRDRFEVINDLTAAMVNRWDSRELFNHGGVISRLKGSGMVPVDKGVSRDLIQETAITVNEIETAQGTTFDFTWPDPSTISATLSRADKFSPLERISHAPFVRPDGSIVTEPGYDEATKTMLVPDPEVAGLEVPDHPTRDQVRAAVDLIMTDWLGDFPFDGDADRANVLALILTPAIRGLVPRVPLAVVDGLQMGVGKNKIADTLLTVYTGQESRPMNFVDDKEELRKQITSAFRTGAEFFVFDEAHTIEGPALAQALTASTWQDRILGVSTMAEFPNRVTWMSLGNQVQIRGDLTRRVYRIAIRPDYANPQDRAAHTFRHPGQSGLQLEEWVRANRREILRAILILVRAWFSAGQPYPSRGVSFGSFETWERIVGGIIATAGLEGFLTNLTVWRSESDFDTQYWCAHLAWLVEQFGDQPFRGADVKSKALADPAGYLAPPRLDDPADRGYTKALGEAYSRLKGRRYEGMRIERQKAVAGHVSLWRVVTDGAGPRPDWGQPSTPPSSPADQDDKGYDGDKEDLKEGDAGGGNQASPDTATAGRSGRDGNAGDGGPGVVSGRGPLPVVLPDDEGPGPAPGTPGSAGPVVAAPGEGPPEDDPGREADSRLGNLTSTETQASGDQVCADTQALGVAAGLLTFDLETGDAGDLYRTPGTEYVRLAGWAVDDGPVEVQERGRAGLLAFATERAAVITGHNIMAFDLPALVRAGRLTMGEVHELARGGRLFDGLLAARFLDPPMAREKGVDAQRRHDLDSLASRLGLGEKHDAAKILAKKYGGWDRIPIDSESEDGRAFRAYLTQDVELSRAVYRTLLDQMGGEMPKYLLREHRVAALATQMSINGFLVDQAELGRRVAEINKGKAQSLSVLARRYGVPLQDAKGKLYKSPLGTKLGKAALEKALTEAGATSIWKTASTGQVDISGSHMIHLTEEYRHIPAVCHIARHVHRIVSARTVYETVAANLCPDGRVHPRVAFKQATGRWSLTEPGLTVMGKRGGRHVEREIFLPDPGQLLVAVDLSQVDMRAVAGLSGDQAYIAMLGAEDPHAEIAKTLFGDVKRREQAKAIGHGWNYGRGIQAISQGEEIDPDLVRQFDASMRQRFPRLVEWQGEVRAQAESGDLLDNRFGRKMRPDPRRAYTQGPALMGQGAARDIMMHGLLQLADARPDVLPMLRAQIHDEIVLSVPVDQVKEVTDAVVEAFTWVWEGVPILADGSKPGKNWGAVYEK